MARNDKAKPKQKNENADQIFFEGVRVFEPHPNAPEFVKANVVFSLNELFAFAKANPQFHSDYEGKKQMKAQLLESQNGNLYFIVDQFKPEAKKAKKATPKTADEVTEPIEDLPF